MRFSIRKKLMLMAVVLSAAIIVASVLISSELYSRSLKQSREAMCADAVSGLCSAIEGEYSDFLESYSKKVGAVYEANCEELEQIMNDPDFFESIDKREEYFDELTTGIFPPKNAFGLSYEMAMFNNNYSNLLREMDMISAMQGFDISSVVFYDAKRGNMVYLADRQPEHSVLYNYPAAVAKPWDDAMKAAFETGEQTVYFSGDEWIAISPVRSGELTTPVYVILGIYSADIGESVRLFSRYTLWILLGATAVIALFTLLFADRLIVRNVKKLASAAESFTSQIHGGSPERVSADVVSKDEIGELSEKFGLMQDSIIGYISSLAEKTAKEERLKTELSLAARIQAESLPKGGLKAEGASLESFLKPAREVGGDLYDYFMLDRSRMFFCLADVSGKGVPASLFMMRAKELIRSHVMTDSSLSDLAEKLNNELCAGNEESIFITAFFGIFDTESGLLKFLQAGHERPMLRRGGEVTAIGEESNLVLGVFEDVGYTEEQLDLLPGDVLFMFTDGLNEGINERNEAFGYKRIAETLKTASDDITGEEYAALLGFCGQAEQFDDVTMLALSIDKTRRTELRSPSYNDITAVTDGAIELLSGFDRDRVSEVGLIIDEIMNNQISYAFADTAEPRMTVEVGVEGDDAVLTFEDNGTAFDPLTEVTDGAVELSEGGFGIQLVRSLSDKQSYERRNGLNRLTITKNMLRGPGA